MLVAVRRSAEAVRAELTRLDEELESNPGTTKRPDLVAENFQSSPRRDLRPLGHPRSAPAGGPDYSVLPCAYRPLRALRAWSQRAQGDLDVSLYRVASRQLQGLRQAKRWDQTYGASDLTDGHRRWSQLRTCPPIPETAA
jgi:hypothetical protein